MDTSPISTTSSAPQRISYLEYDKIRSLISCAQRALKNSFPSQEVQASTQALQSHLDSLQLPTCPIQYVAWMHPVAGSLEKMKCVCFSFFIPSLPDPQQFWTLDDLPEEIMLDGAPLSSLKECLRPTFSAPCIWSEAWHVHGAQVTNWDPTSTSYILNTKGPTSPSDEFYGFRVENWESALQTIERVDLSQKRNSLVDEWKSALGEVPVGSQAHHNYLKNLALISSL